MASAASLLGVRHLGEVVENKPASSLVVSLDKALNGTPRLYVEDRWPINLYGVICCYDDKLLSRAVI